MKIIWLYRELRNNLFFNIFFVLNISIGLIGFVSLDAFKNSLSDTLKQNSKNYLSADFAVSARKKIDSNLVEKIQGILGENTPQSHVVEFFTMISTKNRARLLQVKAIDDLYPFYGSFKLSSGEKITRFNSEKLNTKKAWVYPEVLTQFNLKIGDKIKIGNADFIIDEVIVEDLTQTFRISSLAPRVYVGIQHLEETGLIKFGTTLTESYLFYFPDEKKLETKIEEIKKAVDDVAIRFLTPVEASEDSGRVLNYLTDYMGLVSLVALFLAMVGSGFLFRSYLNNNLKSVATLNVIGLPLKNSQLIYLFQVMVLGLFAAIISVLISYFCLPLLGDFLQFFSPIPITIDMSAKTAFLTFAVGTLGSVLIAFPFFQPVRRLQISNLFSEESRFQISFQKTDYIFFFPALIFLILMSFFQANSFKIGSLFFLGLIFSILVLLAFGKSVLFFLSRFQFKNWIHNFIKFSITRKTHVSLSVFVSMGLGIYLLSIIPEIQKQIEDEFKGPSSKLLPSLFLFDIQEDQVQDLKYFFSNKNVPLENISPLIRGRIIKVNDINWERAPEEELTREQEEENRFRNRGVNISFRNELFSSEKIIKGKNFSIFSSGSLPEISLELKYAERLGVKIGDVLTFDIQGIEIQAKIVNFRSVKWNSFQPNFFILIQPGVLEAAPKTFLASIPQGIEIQDIQVSMAEQFPNISAIEVSRVVKRVLDITHVMGWALKVMAVLSIIAGFFVLLSIIIHQLNESKWDMNMLKILGANYSKIYIIIVIQYTSVVLFAGLVGSFLSKLTSMVINYYIFERPVFWDFSLDLDILLCVFILTLIICIIIAHFTLRKRSREVLFN